uniref:Uncharacterized protein n=1 Tax=Lygus hesperus TaxID=30085 RepID=A0A146LRL2_LYGHE
MAVEIFKEITIETVCLNFGIFAVIMLFGAAKGDHELVLPWILLQTLFLLKFTVSMFSMMMYTGLMDYSDSLDIWFELIVVIYFSFSILVVHNFYRQLKESSGRI